MSSHLTLVCVLRPNSAHWPVRVTVTAAPASKLLPPRLALPEPARDTSSQAHHQGQNGLAAWHLPCLHSTAWRQQPEPGFNQAPTPSWHPSP